MKKLWWALTRNYFLWVCSFILLSPLLLIYVIIRLSWFSVTDAIKAISNILVEAYRELKSVEIDLSRKHYQKKKRHYQQSNR